MWLAKTDLEFIELPLQKLPKISGDFYDQEDLKFSSERVSKEKSKKPHKILLCVNKYK